MELDDGAIIMKRIPGISGESREPPGTSGDLPARPWDPPGTPLEPNTDHQEPPRTTKKTCLYKCSAPEPLDYCIRIRLLQRIAQETPWTVLSCIR